MAAISPQSEVIVHNTLILSRMYVVRIFSSDMLFFRVFYCCIGPCIRDRPTLAPVTASQTVLSASVLALTVLYVL